MKMSSTPGYSVISLIDISNVTKQSDIISRLVTYRKNCYLMDPSQSEPLMKSSISIEQDTLRCDTFVLVDSVATLSFVF